MRLAGLKQLRRHPPTTITKPAGNPGQKGKFMSTSNNTTMNNQETHEAGVISSPYREKLISMTFTPYDVPTAEWRDAVRQYGTWKTKQERREILRRIFEEMEKVSVDGERPTCEFGDGRGEMYWRDHPYFQERLSLH
jgi:hypothetical protein